MLCCLETPWSSNRDAYHRQTGDFPGNRRRFVPTAGNALAAAPPPEQQHQQQTPPSLNGIRSGGDVVCVTIPPGISSGQSILVTDPNGSGRTVSAAVPPGMMSGSRFMVEFPPTSATAMSSSPPASVVTSSVASSAPPKPEPLDYSEVEILPPPAHPQTDPAVPFAQAVPIGASPTDITISAPQTNIRPNSSPMPATFGQPMLRVQVPSGTTPGSTLRVSIPGENHTISAVVPPGNVSSFHVPYEPRQQRQQEAAPRTGTVEATNPQSPPNFNNQKLVLVRVPPGTEAGTVLHVSIPDEPGRLIAATVPPNVSEFKVAYEPSNPSSSMNGQFQQPQRYSDGQRRTRYNSNGRNSNNNNNNLVGSMLLPAIGGAALGMAGMGFYDHFRHSNNGYDESNNGYGDGSAGNDHSGGDDAGFNGGFDDFGDFWLV